jgi:predicted porin
MDTIMKKTALSLAIAAMLPTLAFAEVANNDKVSVNLGEPKFYGKVNVSLQNTQEAGASTSEVVSNASRLGANGEIKLDHGLTGIYQLEYETAIDDGGKSSKSGQTFVQRNIFVGLEGAFGYLVAGHFDTPLKRIQKKVDLFGDLEGDIKSVITSNDNRKSNSALYKTPKFSGLVATIAHISSEDETINDGTSSSLTYDRNKFYAAIAYDTDVEENGIDVTRLVSQYSVAGITFGGLWETQQENGDNLDGWVYSVSYKATDAATLKVQYGESDIVKEINDDGDTDNAETYSLGIDYKLAKKVKVFAFLTDEKYDIAGSSNGSNQYYGVGTEFKF